MRPAVRHVSSTWRLCVRPTATRLSLHPPRALSKAKNGFDDAKHRLGCLLALSIAPLAFGGRQAMGHASKGVGLAGHGGASDRRSLSGG